MRGGPGPEAAGAPDVSILERAAGPAPSPLLARTAQVRPEVDGTRGPALAGAAPPVPARTAGPGSPPGAHTVPVLAPARAQPERREGASPAAWAPALALR